MLTQLEGNMKKQLKGFFGGAVLVLILFSTNNVWAQSTGHASVGLGHGEEGYLHLEEMIKHFEFGMEMPDASDNLKMHGAQALKHAREAKKHYDEALKHASESLGRPAKNPMMGGMGEGSDHSHEEGSGTQRGPRY
jgi:hypothetical protein